MKTLKVTTEKRAYSEDEAKEEILRFREKAKEEGYTVGAAGYTYKSKKKKGEICAEGWLVKCVAIINDFWEEDE